MSYQKPTPGPTTFRFLDFLYHGIPALLLIALAAYVQTTPQSTEAYALMWTLAALFVGVYALVLYWRHSWLNSFDFVTKHGLVVKLNGYETTRIEIEEETERLIAQYEDQGFPARKMLAPDRRMLDVAHTYVHFQHGYMDHPNPAERPAKVAGWVRAGGHLVAVSYLTRQQPVAKTAFAHELGHIVLGRFNGLWGDDSHHKIMQIRGLT